MSKWRIGVYLRLSSEDGDKEESNSISTQRSIIDYYLSDFKDIKKYKEYIDDGYTGTDFNRPGFEAMLEDIYSKNINAIIVKDLSRLGRNYIKVGDFIDDIIIGKKVRFISINDSVDSYLNPESLNSLEVPIKNLMNEGYAKDTSNKIRSSHKTSKKNGKYIGVVAPYGYIKDKEDGHKFIVDSSSAEVVKKIFNYVIKGLTKQDIADELNKQHILTPSKYFKDVLKYKRGRVSNQWNVKMLDEILKNETYIGNLIQGKRQRLSHKTHNIVRVSEDEWIKSDNHHKPIIKETIFNQVQNILYNRNIKINSSGSYNTYSGYIKCADCNCNLYRRFKRDTGRAFYYCGTYIKSGTCSKHYITEEELNETVLIMLNKYLELLIDLKAKINDIISFSSIEYNSEVRNMKIIEYEKDIEKYEKLISDLKKDYQLDIINKEDFEDFYNEYLYELNNLKLAKEEIENQNEKTFNLYWLNNLKKLEKLDSINKLIVDEFIENIYIYEDRRIKIDFKYIDQYNEAIRYLKFGKSMV